MVDQFCKADSERLSYLCENQYQSRASDYTKFRELLGGVSRTEDELNLVRRLFIQPSLFVGSDWYMLQEMYDTIGVSNKIRHPDIFLTVMCNPNSPDICCAFLPGQTPKDRPELSA